MKKIVTLLSFLQAVDILNEAAVCFGFPKPMLCDLPEFFESLACDSTDFFLNGGGQPKVHLRSTSQRTYFERSSKKVLGR